ncbi:unnamed protein product [Acanthoscelides obtectus]|uniref:Uncharacterized protein n=1 Tax=Acanthoscelides obtectus TaxID=200917 RepID=A0A9P0KQ10_ACAOB|nr:unnamed protein product [Acanthoscelides obtectus]CAK1677482.1 hypothetical protein AOBTE_LOCUS31357 [Acanthoscelides obtectus]
MKLGLQKCACLHIRRGKVQCRDNAEMLNGLKIRTLTEEDRYKYLGVLQASELDAAKTKELVRLKERVKHVLTKLSSSNIIQALNTWAFPDQVVPTRAHIKNLQNQPIESDRCRRCNTTAESIQHVVSGCSSLAPTEYLARHNMVAKIIHQGICKNHLILEHLKPAYKNTRGTSRAMPGFQSGIAEELGCLQTTVSRIFHDVLERIVQQAEEFIRFTNTKKQTMQAKGKWLTRFRFPTAIGVIDCTHIRLDGKPAQFGDEYNGMAEKIDMNFRRRRKYYSLLNEI